MAEYNGKNTQLKQIGSNDILHPETNVEQVLGLQEFVGDFATHEEVKTSVNAGIQTSKEYAEDLKKSILGEDITEAFDTLREVEVWIGEHGTQASELMSGLQVVEEKLEDVDSVRDELDGLQSRLKDVKDGLDSDVSDLNDKIDGVQGDLRGVQTALEDRLDSLESDYATKEYVDGKVDDLKNKLLGEDNGDGDFKSFKEVQTWVDEHETDVETKLGNINDKITGVQTELNNFKTEVSNTYVTKTDHTNDITGVQTELKEIIDGLGDTYVTITNHTNDIAGVQAETTDLLKKLKLDILGDDLTTTFDTLKEVQDWVDAHEGQAANLVTGLQNLETRVDGLQTRVENLEKRDEFNKTEYEATIKGLQDSLKGLQQWVEDHFNVNVYAIGVQTD